MCPRTLHVANVSKNVLEVIPVYFSDLYHVSCNLSCLFLRKLTSNQFKCHKSQFCSLRNYELFALAFAVFSKHSSTIYTAYTSHPNKTSRAQSMLNSSNKNLVYFIAFVLVILSSHTTAELIRRDQMPEPVDPVLNPKTLPVCSQDPHQPPCPTPDLQCRNVDPVWYKKTMRCAPKVATEKYQYCTGWRSPSECAKGLKCVRQAKWYQFWNWHKWCVPT